MNLKLLRRITTTAIILALMVVMLGAYTRLTDAGLGCPDWPGCYGRMVLPTAQAGLSHAQAQYPTVALEAEKAWTEMVHRYAAGTLGLLILIIFIRTVIVSRGSHQIPKVVPGFLMVLVIFQALLGMWTVTLKLLPVVVMGHLLGGILIFASLCYFRWQISEVNVANLYSWRKWIGFAAFILLMQVALGGWVSSNYAGIACVGFPACNGVWWPMLHLTDGFNLLSPVGANYQGGLLDIDARITIQFIHRLGAIVTAAVVLILSVFIIAKSTSRPIKSISFVAIGLVLIQFMLGILNVVYLLPLGVAVAHNGVAAILFATLISMFYLAKGEAVNAP